MRETKEIRVAGKTPVAQLSGSILKSIETGFDVELRAVGASAVNQMYKAIAIARGSLATKDLVIRPGFDTSIEDSQEKTIMLAHLVVM
jgi:stage V sporulation protein SpoVS